MILQLEKRINILLSISIRAIDLEYTKYKIRIKCEEQEVDHNRNVEHKVVAHRVIVDNEAQQVRGLYESYFSCIERGRPSKVRPLQPRRLKMMFK